jgi:hypothetical protein
LIEAADTLDPLFGLYVRVVAATGDAPRRGVRTAVERRRPRRGTARRATQPRLAARCCRRSPDEDPLGAHRHLGPGDRRRIEGSVARSTPAGPLRRRR